MIPSQAGGANRELVRERIEAVLARQEFRRGGNAVGEWIAARWEELVDWLRRLVGGVEKATAENLLRVLLVLLAAAIVATIVARVVRWMRAQARSVAEPEISLDDLRAASAAALQREAHAAARRGEHLAALRLYFRALVVGLSERGELEYRDAWTNRELLERGAPRAEVVPLLRPLVPRLDAQSFGREPAGPGDVARLADLCDRLLARPPEERRVEAGSA